MSQNIGKEPPIYSCRPPRAKSANKWFRVEDRGPVDLFRQNFLNIPNKLHYLNMPNQVHGLTMPNQVHGLNMPNQVHNLNMPNPGERLARLAVAK